MTSFGSGNQNFGYRQSSGGGGLRFIIALVVAVVGIVGYFSHTQINPVTGEKQHISLTVDQEKSLGLQAAPQMASQMGGEADPSDPAAIIVRQIGAELVAKSDAAKSPYRDNFKYHLLNDPQTINAFALPGGQVFITRALYDRLETTAQLAGVLGHETGHVIGRHSAEQMAQSDLGNKLATAVAIGGSNNRDGQFAAIAAAMANQMLQLHYSRHDELEADNFGLRYMAQAGYSPAAMRQVMDILKRSVGNGSGPNIFQTHPDPDARIAAIDAFLQETYPNGIPSNLTDGKRLH